MIGYPIRLLSATVAFIAILTSSTMSGRAVSCPAANTVGNAGSALIGAAHRNSTSAFASVLARYDILGMRLNSRATRFISWSHKIKTFLNLPIIQTNCLTTAVYFEARSEPKMGQLAVARVILNRIQASNSSICAVVYRGASHFNACQFSFTCDGKPNLVDDTRAWQTAVEVTSLAMANDGKRMGWPMEVLATAINYHADNVNPNWSKSLTRLTKIGRHIFYSQTPAGGTPGSRKSYI